MIMLILITDSHQLLDEYQSVANNFYHKIFGCSSQNSGATDSSVLSDFYHLFLQSPHWENKSECKQGFYQELNLLNKLDNNQVKENFKNMAKKWIAPAMLQKIHDTYHITVSDIHQPLVQIFEFLQSNGLEK